MSNPPTSNIAARAGRWSAAHRKTAIFGWLALVVVALAVGSALGTKTLTDDQNGTGSSGHADRVLAAEFKQPAAEQVLVQARHGQRATDPVFTAAVRDVVARVGRLPQVAGVQSPLQAAHRDLVSKDGGSALVTFKIRGPSDKAADKIDPVLAATAAAQRAHPDLRIAEFGDASSEKALDAKFSSSFQTAETLSLPITLVILLVTFGALMAAGLPLLLALTSVAGTLGFVGITSQFAPVDQSISSVVLLVGMAVGIDYSLFYMRREREERAAGRSAQDALDVAAATSGRAVLVSGLTVMVAMAGMYLTGDATFGSFATGTIIVVAMAMIGSITVLPALLSKLGDRVEKGRVPFIGRRRAAAGDSRVWGAVLRPVLRHPAISGAAALAVLVVLAIPALSLHTAQSGASGLPQDMPVVKTYNAIEKAFPGGPLPASVVIQADDVTAPRVTAAIADLRSRALASPQMGGPISVSTSPSHRVAVVSIPLAGDGTDARSDAALATLRTDLVPHTVGAVDGVRADVGGGTAGSKDFNDLLKSRAPLVFAFVLAMAFLLLLVTFRSIVVALKAIVLNMLSVAASYGVLVWVFQKGHGEKLLGFHSTGAITAWLPLFMFVILFGLSMDYHVFILSRIREAYDRGMSTEAAVSHGVRSTAGVVTSAAVVMVGVFSIFAVLPLLDFKQMGIGLAVAILLDATIIRGVLLPAAMTLLGDANWYLPAWLDRLLPQVERERSTGPLPEGARA